MQEELNKWRLVLGSFAEGQLPLGENDRDLEMTLDFLYSREYSREQGIREKGQGGRESSQLTVPEWIQKIRRIFPKQTVEILQKQALEKYQIMEILMDEQILKKMQPDMELLKNILTFKNHMKGAVIETARKIVEEVVRELEKELKKEIESSFLGKKNPYKSSQIRTIRNFDFKKTVKRNLKYYDQERKCLIPHQFYFTSRIRKYHQYHVIIVVDESGSMLDSVIYSAIMASIFAKLPMLRTDLILFDTKVVDLSGYVSDPVELLMSIQLGGGTDIYGALSYVQTKITEPQKTIVVLVSDLCDSYPPHYMCRQVQEIVEAGANMFVLPALDQEGNSSYDKNAAQKMADSGAHVAAITPKELANWISQIVL